MAAKLGLDGKIYYLSTGTRASWGTVTGGVAQAPAPSNLTVIEAVRDITLTIEAGEADVSTRGNDGWKAILATLKGASLEVKAIWDSADTALAAVLTAWLTNATIALAVLDGAKETVGTQGFWADFMVLSVTKGEALEEGQTMDFTIKPTLSAVSPQWVKVTAS